MKSEISYKLKIIGAKKLLAKTCVVKGCGRGFGESLIVAACDYNFSLKCAAKSGLCCVVVYNAMIVYYMTWVIIIPIGFVGETHEYLYESKPVIMGTRNNEAHSVQYLNFRTRGEGSKKSRYFVDASIRLQYMIPPTKELSIQGSFLGSKGSCRRCWNSPTGLGVADSSSEERGVLSKELL